MLLAKIAFGIFAVWFVRGVLVALYRPRIEKVRWVLIEDEKEEGKETKSFAFLTVRRQQLLPPWLRVEEVWFVPCKWDADPVREHDGWRLSSGKLRRHIHSMDEVLRSRRDEDEHNKKVVGE